VTVNKLLAGACVAIALATTPAWAKSGSTSTRSPVVSAPKAPTYKAPAAPKAVPGVPRNSDGSIKRSKTETDNFKKENPCPGTGSSKGSCSGYVIDHVVPLKRGGPDKPSNMQWQTIEQGKAKDKIE
jgi:hypothetical protein